MIEVTKGVQEYSVKSEGNEFLYINGRRSNFQIKEFACHDGSDKVLIDSELIEKLQIIREHFNTPVIINSGYRTDAYNKKVGGVGGSQHTLGKAADIIVRNAKIDDVVLFAETIGFRGIGRYKDFVHVDTRPVKAYWLG